MLRTSRSWQIIPAALGVLAAAVLLLPTRKDAALAQTVESDAAGEGVPCPTQVHISDLGYDGFITFQGEDFRAAWISLRTTQPGYWKNYWNGDYGTVPVEPTDVYGRLVWKSARVYTRCSRIYVPNFSNPPARIPVTVVEETGKAGYVVPVLGGGSDGRGTTDEEYSRIIDGVQYSCYNYTMDDGTRVEHCDAQ